MMMMMIMIAAYVSSITTPIKSWLLKHSSTPPHAHHNMIVKELTVNSSRIDCIVCLSEVVLGERLAMLERCGHGYHVECLKAWLKEHPNCPLCRTPVSVFGSHDQDNHNLYLKKFYDMVSRYGTSALETTVDWLTSYFTQGLQSTLSESCSYL
ncbi:Zinc finger, RING/FYVE/PHD-type [Cynara cardunculus var. scolymus]|uniref:Zinc finger, RING/FYVE/PHD-type n=1 Tax=Cynara cardunculus var. scolymus TaxID=59895 RepID=A0A118K3D8_CYNCS|nr:Zinc finger, RING/FYVE/PHD-type [Cynara cardunculus var. scolymus]